MRILVATVNKGIVGGIETYLKTILPLLRESGNESAFLYEQDAASHYVDQSASGGPSWIVGQNHEGLVAALAWRPDICFSHSFMFPENDSRLIETVPTILFAHGYYGSCISGTKNHAFPYNSICQKPFGPSCIAAYLPRRCGGLSPFKMLKLYREQRRRQSLFKRYAYVAIASQHMRAVMVQNGVPESKVHLLPLFPTHGDRDSDPPHPRPIANTILFAGRITRLKGWTHLIPAVSMASRALGRRLTLVVAGDGPDRERLVRLATKWNVPLDFRGWLEPEPLKAVMRQADLLVVPSLWPEPFGLVGIEAGCVGTPAVAYEVGGIPDWLLPGVSGELAPGDDLRPERLAEAMVRALRDPDHWQRLREGAWRQAGLFSRESHMERLLPILQEAAASR